MEATKSQCHACGAMNDQKIKFCTSCGAAASLPHDDANGPAITSMRSLAIDANLQPRPHALYAILAGLLLIAIAIGAYQFGRSSDGVDGNVQAAMSDAERLAAYSDSFLSDTVRQLTSGPARARNYPTTKGSEVQSDIPAGTELEGRWVKGVDPSTKWLKTNQGYVWDGNLTDDDGSWPPSSLDRLQAESGVTGPSSGWPSDEQVRSVIERSLGRNEMVSGCMTSKPVINSVTILQRGTVAQGVYPLAVEISYVCPAAPMYGLPEERHSKSLKYFFKIDSFGDWQSVPEPK